eukprot:TRINITY_DN4929_c0_g1_i2.p1 TRINITY_DN4929_c0_g1~~TRINITY_DN4929_c0_g1_i2.p1  ORF type:complete len:128 (+),score=20.81 TRINITY_DN4929_c0_g1_i2:238-621(+)
MGRLHLTQLSGRIYSCKVCNTPLANFDDIISKSFHCHNGKAYLFNSVVNITLGPLEERMMTTGLHTIADIYCNCCNQAVGWKYEAVYEKIQKYKEGKYILERPLIVDGDGTDVYMETDQHGSDPDDG